MYTKSNFLKSQWIVIPLCADIFQALKIPAFHFFLFYKNKYCRDNLNIFQYTNLVYCIKEIKMYRRLNLYVFSGIIFTVVLGTLLHFVYDWSGSNPIVGLFSPINESVWEHLKLLYYPMSIWVFIGYFKYGKRNKNYFFAALTGLISGLILIPAIFYLYTSITGKSFLVMDILIFIAGVVTSFLVMRQILQNYNIRCLSVKAGIILWELIFVLFVVFTTFPPEIFLFKPL